jgi:hypothetical protein
MVRASVRAMAESFFDEPNTEAWKKLSPKDALFRFVEYLEGIALDALSDEALGQEQKEVLTRAREGLRPALELLNASMGPQVGTTYTALHWLLGHAFVIAQHEGFLDQRAQTVFKKVKARADAVKGGKTQLAAAKKAWRDNALDLALDILLAEQDILPQEKLATEIAFQWKWKEPCRESMLVTLIREWERDGTLPRRRK